MKKIIKNNWYSTLLVLILVWFMIVLTTWIFRLVINEMNSNRVFWNYIKAYAWAESAQELALLDIKNKGYWYNVEIRNTLNEKSIILASNPLDTWDFSSVNDVLISFTNDWKTSEYQWNIWKLQYDIIPLFHIEDYSPTTTRDFPVRSINLSINSWISNNLSWNIIWETSWISWIWAFSSSTVWSEKKIEFGQFKYAQRTIENFLSSSQMNYLVLFNSWDSEIKYTLTWDSDFTKPRLNITSSWEVWDFKQNLKTKVDNTEFLSILKYSIFSSNN